MDASNADKPAEFLTEGFDASLLLGVRHAALHTANGLVKANVRAGNHSLRGRRPKNDDFSIRSMNDDFFAVSDGIGGAPNGHVISQVACRCAVRAHDQGLDTWDAFRAAAAAAYVTAEGLDQGDGATLLLAERVGNTLTLLSAGDSRAYRFRYRNGKGSLVLLTPNGRAAPSSGRRYNALAKAVGTASPNVQPNVNTVTLKAGDRIILCTDGVWEPLGEEGMCQALERMMSEQNPFFVAEELCNAAVGDTFHGSDNATCYCLSVEAVEYGPQVRSYKKAAQVSYGAASHYANQLRPAAARGAAHEIASQVADSFLAMLECVAGGQDASGSLLSSGGRGPSDRKDIQGGRSPSGVPGSSVDDGSAAVDAQYLLGLYYGSQVAGLQQADTSQPVDQGDNLHLAEKWYGLAAQGGSAYARNNLGVLYVRSHRDKEAARMFREAIPGSARAQVNLGAMYATGRGVSVDVVSAAELYRGAAEQVGAAQRSCSSREPWPVLGFLAEDDVEP